MEERKFGTIDFGEPVDLSQNIIKLSAWAAVAAMPFRICMKKASTA